MKYESQLELLSHLLHKPVSIIQHEALDTFVEQLDPQKRSAFKAFLKVAEAGNPESGMKGAGPGYMLADAVSRMQLNMNTIKGRILDELRSAKQFSRNDFTEAVAKSMQWDETSRKFGVDSRFADLAAADRGWWGTLKGKERLVIARA
jgi:hypothetical protein